LKKIKYQFINFKLLCTILFWSCASNSPYPFKQQDVIAAQKLYGVEFNETEIDTMMKYLVRNRASYDTTRTFNIEYNESPAMIFNPLPNGFTTPSIEQNTQYDLNKDISIPENYDGIAFYSIFELASLIQTKQITSEELTNFYLNRLEKYNPQLEAVITLIKVEALIKAREMDKEIAEGKYRGPLHGIPYGVKDIISVKKYKTTWGAMPYKDQIIDETAEIVEKLNSAGAILIAKLTSGALARGDVWFNGKTRNPWDLKQGSSGSSAGSAAATSAGLVPFSIGTETWGSILSPSSRCGITGLRPTYGRVSRHGVMTLSWSMDKVGPICRDAKDCALILSIINGSDGRDQTVYNIPFGINFKEDIKSLRIGYIQEIIDKDTTDSGTNGLFALNFLKEIGVTMDSVTLPSSYPFRAFDSILRAEAGAYFDKLIISNQINMMTQQSSSSRANSLRQSRFIPAIEYLQANRLRKRLIQEMFDLFKDYDVIIAPGRGSQQSLITNLTGHPSISIPSGFDNKGRPTSITLIGNLFDEASILRFANFYQEKTDHEDKYPPIFNN